MTTFNIKALALVAFSAICLANVAGFAACPSGKCQGSSSREPVVGRYGTYNDYTSRRMTQIGNKITEPMLLNQIDRQTRRLYFSLNEQGRELALQNANSGKFNNQIDAVIAARDSLSGQGHEHETAQPASNNAIKR